MQEPTRPSPFAVWMRTGRWPRLRPTGLVEAKHNIWHDVLTGRFTFRGQGKPSGSWSGGGDFGGGGATGDWGANVGGGSLRPKPSPRKAKVGSRHTGRVSGATTHPVANPKPIFVVPSAIRAPNAPAKPEPWRIVRRNGYEFRIDGDARARELSGYVTIGKAASRSRKAQAAAGEEDRRSTDDGGHYIAHRFNGPSDAFNHFAQDANFNRGAYRGMEDRWAKAIAIGDKVWIHVRPKYDGLSKRPSAIDVSYSVRGHLETVSFPNEHQGKRRGK